MGQTRIADLVYTMGDWIAKFIYLHIIWLLFTLLGLVVFGIMPATAAMFSVMRKWLMKDDVKIFNHFLESYKAYFVEKNILGIVYFLVGLFLYYDFMISYTKIQWSFFHVIIWTVCVVYLIMLAFSMPIYVHFNLKKTNYLKQVFLIVILSPMEALSLLFVLIILFYLFLFIPVLFIFSGSTLIGFPIMWLGLRAFKKIEKKAKVILN